MLCVVGRSQYLSQTHCKHTVSAECTYALLRILRIIEHKANHTNLHIWNWVSLNHPLSEPLQAITYKNNNKIDNFVYITHSLLINKLSHHTMLCVSMVERSSNDDVQNVLKMNATTLIVLCMLFWSYDPWNHNRLRLTFHRHLPPQYFASCDICGISMQMCQVSRVRLAPSIKKYKAIVLVT